MVSKKEKTCCVFGHRTVDVSEVLKEKIYEIAEKLVREKGIDTFLFGSGSRFDCLCLEAVTLLKEKYPHIKRIYVRAEFFCISDKYREYLLESYDDTYYPEEIKGAGKAVYVKRNQVLINNSIICLVYYNENYFPSTRKSGTRLAYDYAIKHKKEIENVFIT